MNPYVLDANAVIRYLVHGRDWQRVNALFDRAHAGEAHLSICAVNWGEVVYTMAKRIGLAQTIADLKVLALSRNVG